MTQEQQKVLLECWRRAEALKVAEPPPKWKSWLYVPYADALEYGPAWEPRHWFAEGPAALSDAQRMRYLRALRRLGEAGLVRIFLDPDSDRVANVKLTPAGVAEAARLMAKSIEPAQTEQTS